MNGPNYIINITCPCNVDPLKAYISVLYCKIGVYRGKHYFLIFDIKHILWVLLDCLIC